MKHNISVDHGFQSLIPPLASVELARLENNIVAEGCRDALTVWSTGDVLLDGHNRYEICTRNGLPFDVRKIDLPDRTAAELWIIRNQLARRNLSEIDRISLAREEEKRLKPKAKERQKEHGGTAPGKSKNTSGKIAKSDLPVSTRREAAKTAGVGERTYDAGKLILDAASKGEIPAETVEKVRRGEAAIHRVAKDIKETRQKNARAEKRAEAVKAAPAMNDRIIVGDFRKHYDKLVDGSVNLIFTDPPYDRKSISLYDHLGEFAAAKLADGGSLLCYVGQTQIPEAIKYLEGHLRYWWTVCCLHAGKATVMREYGVNAKWKAVLWFVKGTRDDNSVFVNDVMSGGQEKEHHDWQQSVVEAQYWIGKLCPEGGLVVDPFLGGGTTAAAAKLLDRDWVGFEIDKAAAATASARVA